MEYLLLVAPINNKLFFGSVVVANQVQFTVTIKPTISRISGTVAGISVSSIRKNSVGSIGNNNISSITEVGVGSIVKVAIGFNAEVNTDNNPENVVVYLGALLAKAIGLVSC